MAFAFAFALALAFAFALAFDFAFALGAIADHGAHYCLGSSPDGRECAQAARIT